MMNTHSNMKLFVLTLLCLILLSLPTEGIEAKTVKQRQGNFQIGIASWYGGGEKLNVCTANGEIFDPNDYTAAIWDYPFGTILEVTNLNNDLSVKVRINDRGPNRRLNRLIDLSRAAFKSICPLSQGLCKVKIERLK